MNLTFGLELEFADVRYGQPLPVGCAWNKQDYSIVNSDGHANCPTGTRWPWGGEINTRPTISVDEQVEVVRTIIDILDPKPVVNYRCNLHVHVGIRGLRNDLVALKALASYICSHQKHIFKTVDPIIRPAEQAAIPRYRRNLRSHHSPLRETQHQKMVQAATAEELYLAHFVTDKRGKPQKHLHQRCGINIRSLWENDETIEFRHFFGTLDLLCYRSALVWCQQFVEAALSKRKQLRPAPWMRFPIAKPYQHDLEVGYLATRHH